VPTMMCKSPFLIFVISSSFSSLLYKEEITMLYSAIDRVDRLSKLISICNNSLIAGGQQGWNTLDINTTLYIPKVIKSLKKGRMSKIFFFKTSLYNNLTTNNIKLQDSTATAMQPITYLIFANDTSLIYKDSFHAKCLLRIRRSGCNIS